MQLRRFIRHGVVVLILVGGVWACKFVSGSDERTLSNDGGADGADQAGDDELESSSLSKFSQFSTMARAFLEGDMDATPCEQPLVSGNPCLVSSFVWQKEADQQEQIKDTWLQDYETGEVSEIDGSLKIYNTVTHAALPYQYSDQNISVSFTEDGLLVMPELWQTEAGEANPSEGRMSQCAPPPGCDDGPCPAVCYEGPADPPNADSTTDVDESFTLSYPQASLYSDIIKPGQAAEFTVAGGEVAIRVHVIAYAKPQDSSCSVPYRMLIYNPKDPQDEYAYLSVEGACWRMATTEKK